MVDVNKSAENVSGVKNEVKVDDGVNSEFRGWMNEFNEPTETSKILLWVKNLNIYFF
jgi:hypothetical protein